MSYQNKNRRNKTSSYAGSPWAVDSVSNMSLFGNSLINSPMGPMMTPFVPGTSFASYTDLGDYGELGEQDYSYSGQSSWKSSTSNYKSGHQSYNSPLFMRGGKSSRGDHGMNRRGNRGLSNNTRGNRGKSPRGDRGFSRRGDRGYSPRADRSRGGGGRGKRPFTESNRGSGIKNKRKRKKSRTEAEPYNPEEPTNEEEEEQEPSNDSEEEQSAMFGAKAPSQDQKLSKAARRKNWCTVCEANFPGSFLVHRRSKEHRKHRDKKFPRCRLCRLSFRGMKDFEEHNETEEHKKKYEDFQALKEQQLMHAALSDSEDDGTSLKKFIASQSDEKTVFRENDDPVGTRHVVPLKVFFCKLCQKLLKNHTAGFQVHCRTVDHIQKYKVFFEGKEARAAERRQTQTTKKSKRMNNQTKDDDQEEVEELVDEEEEYVEEEVEEFVEEEEEEEVVEGEEELVEEDELVETEEMLGEGDETEEAGDEGEGIEDDKEVEQALMKLITSDNEDKSIKESEETGKKDIQLVSSGNLLDSEENENLENKKEGFDKKDADSMENKEEATDENDIEEKQLNMDNNSEVEGAIKLPTTRGQFARRGKRLSR